MSNEKRKRTALIHDFDGTLARDASLLDISFIPDIGMAKKFKFPAKLAEKYPGCLRFDDVRNALQMRSNSRAVCNDSSNGNARYLCDGADDASRSLPSLENLVTSPTQLPVCTDGFFEELSKPR